MLEKDIEKAVCDFAAAQGVLVYKFTSPARRNVPDRMFILPGGRVFFIEFKAPGKKATAGQLREMRRLNAQGCVCYVVDDIERGKHTVRGQLE